MLRIITIILSFQIACYTLALAQTSKTNYCNITFKTTKICQFRIDKKDYKIFPDGLITWKSNSLRNTEVKLSVPEHFYIESAEYEIHEGDIFFIFGITDDDSGSAIVARFDPNQAIFLWSTEVMAFNASHILVENGNVYVAAIGTVAKIQALTGNLVWHHRNLYERDTGAFNAFKRPRLAGNVIVFEESKSPISKYEGVRSVLVEDSTGKILSK